MNALRARYGVGGHRCGPRQPVAGEHKCQTCGEPATHVRLDAVVGGGHRRNVYYCSEHDYPVDRRHVTEDVTWALADSLGGEGWDDQRLPKLVEGWIDWSKPVDVRKAADELLEQGFDPRDLL